MRDLYRAILDTDKIALTEKKGDERGNDRHVHVNIKFNLSS